MRSGGAGGQEVLEVLMVQEATRYRRCRRYRSCRRKETKSHHLKLHFVQFTFYSNLFTPANIRTKLK